MKAKANIVAQRLLNLYRQAHVINGGWMAVNKVFLTESSNDVISELQGLPTGKMLIKHISNLRDGTTPLDSIAHELLPYGGLMHETFNEIPITPEELQDLIKNINEFTPDDMGLQKLQNTDAVKKFGKYWLQNIPKFLSHQPDAMAKWPLVVQTFNAYDLWDKAQKILTQQVNERVQSQIQADMLDYETYLPMFGEAGNQLLKKLRNVISVIETSKNKKSATAIQDE